MTLMLVHLKLHGYITGGRAIFMLRVDNSLTYARRYNTTGTIAYYTIIYNAQENICTKITVMI